MSAFAASAFALLVIVTAQQQAANTATANVVSHAVTMTNYKRVACVKSMNDASQTTNYRRLLNKACNPVK